MSNATEPTNNTKMRTKAEIAKVVSEALSFIIKCGKGCAYQPPGLYCPMCYRIQSKIECLEWVLGRRDWC